MTTQVRLRIDRLVLHGLPRAVVPALVAQLRADLGAALVDPARWSSGSVARARVDAGRLDVQRDPGSPSGARRIATRVAEHLR